MSLQAFLAQSDNRRANTHTLIQRWEDELHAYCRAYGGGAWFENPGGTNPLGSELQEKDIGVNPEGLPVCVRGTTDGPNGGKVSGDTGLSRLLEGLEGEGSDREEESGSAETPEPKRRRTCPYSSSEEEDGGLLLCREPGCDLLQNSDEEWERFWEAEGW